MPKFFRQYRVFGLFRPTITFVLLVVALAWTAGQAVGQTADDTTQAIEIFNRGQEEHANGKLPEAIASYKQALTLIERFPEAEYQLGVAYRQTGVMDLAERSFRRAIEFRDDWSLARAALGMLLVDKGEYSEANLHLGKAVGLDPQNFPAYAAIVELKIRTKAGRAELVELLSKVTALSAKAKPPASIFVAKGALETELGDKRSAAASFGRAFEIDQANTSALRELIFLALDSGDVEKANSLRAQLKERSPSDSSLPLIEARIRLANGEEKEALAQLEMIESPSPSVVELKEKIKTALTTDIAYLEKVAIDEPTNAVPFARLCTLYRIEDPVKALANCRRASELEPNNIQHAIGYAAALVKGKDYPSAIIILRRLLEFEPKHSTIRANLATALFYSKNYADAIKEYRWLTENQPGLPVAYYYLGISHDQLGEFMDAAANYQQFLRLANPETNQLEIEKVNLRMPILQRQIKSKKGR